MCHHRFGKTITIPIRVIHIRLTTHTTPTTLTLTPLRSISVTLTEDAIDIIRTPVAGMGMAGVFKDTEATVVVDSMAQGDTSTAQGDTAMAQWDTAMAVDLGVLEDDS